MRYEVSDEKEQFGFYELVAIYNETPTSCCWASIFASRDRQQLLAHQIALTATKTVLNVKNRLVQILS